MGQTVRVARSEAFKQMAVKRYLLRKNKTVEEIQSELGISSGSLYRWLKKYSGYDNIADMHQSGKRPQDRSAQEKMKACLQFAELSGDSQGEFLRKEGLCSSNIEQWQKRCLEALSSSRENTISRSDFNHAQQRIKDLERDLSRKNKALAETAALLVLKKKADFLWGDEATEST